MLLFLVILTCVFLIITNFFMFLLSLVFTLPHHFAHIVCSSTCVGAYLSLLPYGYRSASSLSLLFFLFLLFILLIHLRSSPLYVRGSRLHSPVILLVLALSSSRYPPGSRSLILPLSSWFSLFHPTGSGLALFPVHYHLVGFFMYFLLCLQVLEAL